MGRRLRGLAGRERRGVRGSLALIAALAPLVPAARRRAWIDQWHGELCHYAQWLERDGTAAPVFKLLARASGAVPHAIQLRLSDWSPRMILHDLTFAWRMFVRRPAFTAVAVLILGLGIGANTTIFSWTQAVLLSPLSGVPRQDRILVVRGTTSTRQDLSLSYPNFEDLRAAKLEGVADLVAFRLLPLNLQAGDQPIRVFGELVSANFFDFFDVRPALGRAFRADEGVVPDGYTPRDGEDLMAYYNQVGPGYFETMGIAILHGRAVTSSDTMGQPPIAVINGTMARRYWPDREAIGGTFRFGRGPVTVVGVARDGKYSRLSEEPRNYVYLPALQNYRPDLVLHVKSNADPALVLPAVRAAVRDLDPNLPLFDVRTVEEHMRISTFIARMAASMLGLFGILGVLLAGVGLYGVIAFNAAQRTREIGLRMALGAGRGQVVWLVLQDGFALAALGIAIGLGLAFGAGRLVAGQLTGVSGADPVSFMGTAALLALVAAVACLLPARRASALSPLTALRTD